MKLQYNISSYDTLKVMFNLYQDGKLTNVYPVYEDEEDIEIAKLEKQGYTYGYTEREVRRAKESYEYKLKRIIKSGDENE